MRAALIKARLSLHRFENGFAVVANALFEDEGHGLDGGGVLHRIAGDDGNIRSFADGQRAYIAVAAQIMRAIQGRDLQRLRKAEAFFRQQLDLALAGEAWNHAAIAGGIGARERSMPPASTNIFSSFISFGKITA